MTEKEAALDMVVEVGHNVLESFDAPTLDAYKRSLMAFAAAYSAALNVLNSGFDLGTAFIAACVAGRDASQDEENT